MYWFYSDMLNADKDLPVLRALSNLPLKTGTLENGLFKEIKLLSP
jgi:hypothetical protein